ncbi:PREDICTED: beta-1,3-galactosyltransferase 1-like [Branchiostoma belcheri]|uniref:Hexosyltransferase n=1 Tax=Branchiostoma belcheri TaxID=7741 RepID=A0A6P4YIU2_BRABE|nr:PREDICTED: beta-1,3-galactosyltransferase 1-like [Branchiostoma belcheri]XP_019618623.1 PREDICTED: beta-1,3-galactosyltransferase 1-like [Branchiostoma belcheri]
MVRVKLRLIPKTFVVLCIITGSVYIIWLRQSLHRCRSLIQKHRKSLEVVINPHIYTFVINSPGKCSGSDVFMVVMVTSAPHNHAQRHAIRHTWGNESNIPGTGIKTVFAVGTTNDASTQQGLHYENKIHKDIIQEDFLDSYKNLTLKTVMCLKWASEFCPNAKFVLKADDDTFVNIFSLVRYLRELDSAAAKRFVTGYVYSGARPIRRSNSRWYLSTEVYPRKSFPEYPAGFAYVISNDITGLIYKVSMTLKYIFLEDVFLGLCLERLNVNVLHDKRFNPWTGSPSCKTGKELASHWVKTHDAMVRAWHNVTKC